MTTPVAAPETQTQTVPYSITRLGAIMTPEPGNSFEVEGVLNPGTAWGPDGQLYLFPRLVAQGNVSRVGRARVLVDHGVPSGVERVGTVLEPDRSWEHGIGHGGVEDPRITHVPSLGGYVMTYVAFGPLGPRPALAFSEDGVSWERLGPVLFEFDDALDCDLNLYSNKDVVFFPEPVPGPNGKLCYAVLHRPMWDFEFSRPSEVGTPACGSPDDRPSIWISYIDAAEAQADIRALTHFADHKFVAGPQFDWELLKIGAGPAPLRIPEGWLVLHHGVTGQIESGGYQPQQNVRYAAGAMILSADDPSVVLARTSEPLLEPSTDEETEGTVSNVVFPTAIEKIGDSYYTFYGMADTKIGVARLDRINI